MFGLAQRLRLPKGGTFIPVAEIEGWNSRKTTLVINDMQYQFMISDAVVEAALEQIRLAKKFGWSCVVVENNGSGSTMHKITDLLDELAMPYTRVTKYGFDGGMNIIWTCKDRGYPTEVIRFVGAYTEFCVRAGVSTVARESSGTSVVVVDEACEPCTKSLDPDWYADYPNVFIIKRKDDGGAYETGGDA